MPFTLRSLIASLLISAAAFTAQAQSRCHEIFGSKYKTFAPVNAKLSPRERLIKSMLTANMQMPQIDEVIRFSNLDMILRDPAQFREALLPVTDQDLQEAAERMNRAHAAFGVAHRTIDHPAAVPGKQVTRQRMSQLMNGFQDAVVGDFITLASRIEPDAAIWSSLKNMYPNQRRVARERVVTEFEQFLVRQKLNDPTSKLGAFHQVIVSTNDGTPLKAYSKQYREHIRKLIEKNGYVDNSARMGLNFNIRLNLKRFFAASADALYSPSEAAEIKTLYLWGL